MDSVLRSRGALKNTFDGPSASKDDGEVLDVEDEYAVVWTVVVSTSNSTVVVFATPVEVSITSEAINCSVTVSLVVE